MSGTNTVSSVNHINDDCLEKIFRHFSARERVSQISLVCKAWQRVERTHPCQPERLKFGPMEPFVHDSRPLMRWHLRDPSRLQEVSMGIPSLPFISVLLECLRHRAPALRSLTLSPTHFWGQGDPHPLALISQLSQLTRLRVSSWEGENEDFAAFRHLRGLGNLQELELSYVTALSDRQRFNILECGEDEELGNAIIQRGGRRFQRAIAGMTQLTALKLIDVEFMECSARQCSWTHLSVG